jgi:hypothetical protein
LIDDHILFALLVAAGVDEAKEEDDDAMDSLTSSTEVRGVVAVE